VQTLRVTEEHPFYVEYGGWAAARELLAGQRLLGGVEPLAVVANDVESHFSGIPVYNLQVERAHTYFVRAANADGEVVWVHNAGARYDLMGATPSKFRSTTGSAVQERMLAEGNLVTTEKGTFVRFLDPESGNYRWTSIKNTDMAHRVDAVAWWNEVAVPNGYAPRSAPVRQFMLDPNNYELQPYWINRSNGAKLRTSYQVPE
jgi:hypothetical protein